MELMDLIIIGAGWSGIAIAKTYREVYPTATILVIDEADTIGGTWAKHRLHPGLRSNNMFGTFEFSDFPMDEATFGVKPGEFIPGHVIHEYLRKYAEKFDVYRLIRFGVTVETVESVSESEGDGEARWKLTTTLKKEHSATTPLQLFTRKLVIATGMTSIPAMPSIPGSAGFSTPLLHSRDLLQHVSTLKTATRITVLGANKSGWDVAYEFATRGIPVDMIIRSSGRGPRWMAPPYVTPLKRPLEQLVHIRSLTWFSPCVWGEATGIAGFVRRALHGTGIGRSIVRSFFKSMGNDVLTLNGYDKHPNTAKLTPWTDPMWIGATGLGILNYPTDFFELVRNGIVTVHIGNITHLSPKTVHLDTGVELTTDALVCTTGWKWKPGVKFVPESLQSSLGLPSAIDDEDAKLALKADEEIVSRFPILMNSSPPKPSVESSTTSNDDKDHAMPFRPYRLYHFMVPPALIEERSIAFAGCMTTIFTPVVAQVQALWITAYFSSLKSQANDSDRSNGNGDVFLPSSEKAKYETMLHTEFCRLRAPEGFGNSFPDLAFETLAYLDLLLKDLGLSGRRKAWWREWWDAYGPKDYRGVVGEWLATRG